MKKALRWLGDYWWIPLLVVVLLIPAIVYRREGVNFLVQKIITELGAIESKREAREVKIQLGTEQAREHVKEKYAEKIKSLDTREANMARELEHDPVRLASYLERLTRIDCGG